MIRFAEMFSEEKIVHALSAQLGRTHFRQIIYLDDPLQRDFYAEALLAKQRGLGILASHGSGGGSSHAAGGDI